MNWDSGKASEGRSIGDVHDKSAPTDIRIILLKAMIGPYTVTLSAGAGAWGSEMLRCAQHDRAGTRTDGRIGF